MQTPGRLLGQEEQGRRGAGVREGPDFGFCAEQEGETPVPLRRGVPDLTCFPEGRLGRGRGQGGNRTACRRGVWHQVARMAGCDKAAVTEVVETAQSPSVLEIEGTASPDSLDAGVGGHPGRLRGGLRGAGGAAGTGKDRKRSVWAGGARWDVGISVPVGWQVDRGDTV